MKIDALNSDIKILASKPVFFHLVNELVKKKMQLSELSIDVQNIEDTEIHGHNEWLRTSSFISLVVTTNFISRHFSTKSEPFNEFLKNFKSLALMFKERASDLETSNPPSNVGFAPLLIIFRTPKNDTLIFQISNAPVESIISAFLAAFRICNEIILKKRTALLSALKYIYKQPDGIFYLKFTETGWKVADILNHACSTISERYLKENDFRVKKPWIVFQENNLHKYKVTSNNWVLVFDKLSTLMLQPNDVSIYSNICNQNLELARKFYKKTILPRHQYYTGDFPIIEQQQEYFDYFQIIITSIIFAYTALEAFVNICIPDNFTHEEEKNGIKTIYSKVAIERIFPLRDKLKKVITKVLKTSDPTQEKWWSRFVELEDLRNGIIHTKQSSSSSRYSKLLTKNIFTLVNTHKEIINYYGNFINLNKPGLLEDFPYNFGYNNVVPGLTDSPEYDHWVVDVNRHCRQENRLKTNDRIL